MKKFLSTTAAALMLAATITSCQKEDVSSPAAVTNGPDRVPTTYELIAQHMMQKNMGNGAIFITPEEGGMNFGILRDVVFDMETFTITSGELASFGASYGNGDFMRQNPDGTVTVKINSNSADADYNNFGTQESYLGTGHMNLRFSGDLITFDVPFPPFQISFVSFNSDYNAMRINGHADVTLNGEPGDVRQLTMSMLANPGQQGGIDFTFN